MSDSLENMAEMQSEIDQPNNGVAPELEENTPPQGDTEEMELVIEAEGDQLEEPKTNMSQEQAYAAFRKEKEKRQRKNEELEAAAKREKELLERISKLEGTVGGITKGAPPTLESCDWDEQFVRPKDARVLRTEI